MNKQTLILDSSQISTYLECPQMWDFRYNESIGISDEIREDMAAGTYGHKLLEIYYTAIGKGCPRDAAVAAANSFHLNDDFPLSAERRKLVHDRFGIYWMTYSHQDLEISLGAPRYKLSFGTHNLEMVSLNDYKCTKCDTYMLSEESNDPCDIPIETFESEPLVEQGFSYELLNDRNYLFVLEGRIDLIGKLNNQLVWMDHKFQGRRHDLYKKAIQFRNYSLATNLTLGIVNYIRLHKEITKDTFVRDIVSFGPRERQIWRDELIDIFKHIAQESDKPRRKNWGACAGRFGFPCEFTKLCEETELVTIEAIKTTYYKKKEKWSPW